MFVPVALPRSPVVVMATILLVLGACKDEDAAPATDPAPAETPSPVIEIVPAPVLDRTGLLEAMDAAATDYASGQAGSSAVLAGRRFVVRQAFGCRGPVTPPAEGAANSGLAAWSWGDRRQSQKLILAPADWTTSPLIAGGAESWEGADGLWLARPWLRSEACPARADGAQVGEETTASPQVMGLAAVFEKAESRLGRRNGRAYEFTVRSRDDAALAVPADGYRVVFEGRMTAFADGRTIHCRATSPDQRPVCIGAVQLDRVAFEDSEGKGLSEWRGG